MAVNTERDGISSRTAKVDWKIPVFEVWHRDKSMESSYESVVDIDSFSFHWKYFVTLIDIL